MRFSISTTIVHIAVLLVTVVADQPNCTASDAQDFGYLQLLSFGQLAGYIRATTNDQYENIYVIDMEDPALFQACDNEYTDRVQTVQRIEYIVSTLLPQPVSID